MNSLFKALCLTLVGAFSLAAEPRASHAASAEIDAEANETLHSSASVKSSAESICCAGRDSPASGRIRRLFSTALHRLKSAAPYCKPAGDPR